MKLTTIIITTIAIVFLNSFAYAGTANFVEEPSLELVLGDFSQFQPNVQQRLSFAQKLIQKACYETVEVLLRDAIALNSNVDQAIELQAARAYVQGLAGNVGHSRFVLSSLSRKYAKRSVLLARAYSYLHCQPAYERAGAVILRRAAKLK